MQNPKTHIIDEVAGSVANVRKELCSVFVRKALSENP